MLCAFYLGLVSGQKAGFESAQTINLTTAAKLPIPDQYRSDELDSVSSKVYAKLNPSVDELGLGEEDVEDEELPELPQLGMIETTRVVRNTIDSKDNVLDEDNEELREEESENGNIITILSKPPSLEKNKQQVKFKDSESQKTIGSLKREMAALPDGEEDDSAGLAKNDSLPPPSVSNDVLSNTTSVLESLKNEPVIAAQKSLPVVQEKKVLEQPKVVAQEPKAVPAKQIEAKPTEPKVTESAQKLSEPAPTKQEQKSPFVKSRVSGGWYAQVAATEKVDDANALAKKLKESGFPVVIEEANIRGEEYYRVLVGPEDERRYSETMVQQLKRETYLKSDPFIKLIK